MRVSEHWLREWIKTPLSIEVLAARLTAAGIEVAHIDAVAPPLKHVVVARIIAAERHPDADSLQVCRVDIGAKTPLQIVCGAANAAVDVRAPLAMIGAQLPGGRTIAKTSIRGIESQGMLCSGAELGLEESSNGLFLLEKEAKPGKDLTDYLGLDDRVLEVELTPNRGDCLSVRGLARELAAITGGKLTRRKTRHVKVSGAVRPLSLKLTAKADCPRYLGQAIHGIDPRAQTPEWMRERLRRSGMRSIHPVVDVTNYVMLELGQPMHAFDLARIDSIEVRHAKKGERLLLLDDREVELIADTLVIADGNTPLAIAGVMGGRDSAVSVETTDIFLESAFFKAETITRYARQYGLHTESSHRFERGVDPQLQAEALAYAAELIVAIAGGTPGKVQQGVAAKFLPKPAPIRLRADRIETVLGMSLRASEINKILNRLSMRVTAGNRAWGVTPPSYRSDIQREEDLIEELVRLHGYEKLAPRLPRMPLQTQIAGRTLPVTRVRDVLIARGYSEAITYSFVDAELQQLFAPDIAAPKLLKPLSQEMGVMRTTLLPGLIGTLRHNLNRQQPRVKVFEIGRCFAAGAAPDNSYSEELRIAGVWVGDALPEQWGAESRVADFFDLKNDVAALVLSAGQIVRIEPGAVPYLHPGRSATMALVEAGPIGRLGQLHPNLAAKLELPPVLMFEAVLNPLLRRREAAFGELSKFPSIRRDLSLIVPQSVPAGALLRAAAEAGGDLVTHFDIFDHFQGEGIDSGRKSLGITLTLQDSSRTLNDEAVETVMAKVIAALEHKFGARLRQ